MPQRAKRQSLKTSKKHSVNAPVATNDLGEKLYVIFHGAWAFVDNQGEAIFHAYAAKADHHVYLGGTWMSETSIAERSVLEISGVTASASPDSIWQHALEMLMFERKAATPAAAYAEVQLPRPDRIYAEMQIPNVQVLGDPTFHQGSTMCLVPVFEFTRAGNTLVKAADGSVFWTAPDPASGSGAATTLHFFAADTSPGTLDPRQDFTAVAALLDRNASIRFPGPAVVPKKVNTPGLVGREAEVTTFLHKRQANMHASSPTPVLWIEPLPRTDHPALVAADLSSCGGGGGGS